MDMRERERKLVSGLLKEQEKFTQGYFKSRYSYLSKEIAALFGDGVKALESDIPYLRTLQFMAKYLAGAEFYDDCAFIYFKDETGGMIDKFTAQAHGAGFKNFEYSGVAAIMYPIVVINNEKFTKKTASETPFFFVDVFSVCVEEGTKLAYALNIFFLYVKKMGLGMLEENQK